MSLRSLAPLLGALATLTSLSTATSAAPQTPAPDPLSAAAPQDPRPLGLHRLIPNLAARDLDNHPWSLASPAPPKATVIALTSPSCPITRKYAPALARLQSDYASRGVRFIFLNPGRADADDDLRAFAKSSGFTGPVIPDRDSTLAAALGARTTAEVFVLDPARTLRYRGCVDDQYALSAALDAPPHAYLRDALDALLAGHEPRITATGAPGCLLDLPADHALTPAAPNTITYHNRISRIIQSNCVTCHRDRGVAPFPLDTYAAVSSRASMLAAVVDRNQMPPWFAAPAPEGHDSPWANDRSLSRADKADLLAWLRSDRPQGDPKDAPLPPRFDDAQWALGTPDAVLQLPAPIDVKAEGTMPYQHVRIEVPFDSDKWVRGFEVLPTSTAVVHHVLVFLIPPHQPGDPPAERLRELVDETRGFFAAYVPGNGSVLYPDGVAKPLPKGSSLLFQLHYTPNGKATKDQTRLALYFSDKPPAHTLRVAGIASRGLQIPPGAPDHPVSGRIPVPADVKVLAFMPHMHLRGKAFSYEAILPDNSRQPLLEVPRYDFNWQLRYELRQPISLPKGSTVRATGRFDNSDDNPNNPDPHATVRWGPQTTDEMMLGYVEYYLASEDDTDTLGTRNRSRDADHKPGAEPDGPPDAESNARNARILKALDKNGDGKIQRSECPQRLLKLFDRLDKNHDSELTKDELPNP